MVEEKIFTIPLRKAWRGSINKRANKSMIVIQEFLSRHMKSDEIKIGQGINEVLWESGRQNPPRRIRIHATKHDDVVYAEVLSKEIKKPSEADAKKKEEKKKAKKEKIEESRKERKKMTVQEEVAEESGQKVTVADRPSELTKDEPKEVIKVQKEKLESIGKK